MEDLRALVEEAKDKPCVDCGHRHSTCVMDLDHLDSTTKVAKVSSLVYTGSKQVLLDEIAKCEVVCANCHRLRTQRTKDKKHGKQKT